MCAGIAEQQTGLFTLNLATNNITPEGMHHIAVMLVCVVCGHSVFVTVHVCVCVYVCACICV